MPIVMMMRWEGATVELYRALRKEVDLESNPPPGGMYHVVAFDDRGARITDVWESAEHFNAFVETRLMPAVAKVGIPGQPQIEILPAVEIYAPAYQPRT